LDEVVVATTLDSTDDPVFAYCQQGDIRVGRGDAYDVLDRYYQTAKHFAADVIVRITGDCPFIDPALIDEAVKLILPGTGSLPLQVKLSAPRFDFVANRLPPPWGRTYPVGLDIEVFTMDALRQAWKSTISKHQREHVTPYFYEGTPAEQLKYRVPNSPYSSAMTPEGLHIALMHHTPDYGHLRWTVDTPEDMQLVRLIAAEFPDDAFTWREVLELVERRPALTQINARVRHKSHRDVDSRA
jgi:spore coat polysaccharide biosynthesis protein SpsF